MNYTIEKPRGIDIAIQRLQEYLYKNLKWDNIEMYGRVYKNLSKDGASIIPEAYIGKGGYRDVLTNDKKAATIFFVDSDEHTTSNGHEFTSQVSVVFIVNLKTIYPSLNNRPDTEAQLHAEKLIRNNKILKVTSIEKGLETVLADFDIESIKLTDFQPYHIFSIKGNLNYLITNC